VDDDAKAMLEFFLIVAFLYCVMTFPLVLSCLSGS